jgi:hypothetical protein
MRTRPRPLGLWLEQGPVAKVGKPRKLPRDNYTLSGGGVNWEPPSGRRRRSLLMQPPDQAKDPASLNVLASPHSPDSP